VVQRREGQQSQNTGTLDSGRQLALVLRTGTGHTRRQDLAALGDELAQQIRVLVVDLQAGVCTELAELAAALELATTATTTATVATALTAVATALRAVATALRAVTTTTVASFCATANRLFSSGLCLFAHRHLSW